MEGSQKPAKIRKLTCIAEESTTQSAGPFLITASGPRKDQFLSDQCSFEGFKRKLNAKPRHRLLGYATSKMKFVAKNFGETGSESRNLVKYAIGVYDRKEKTVRLVDASMLGLEAQVIALENEQLPQSNRQFTMAARNLLGETFGTKKVKQAIRAMERDKVDASVLNPIAGLIEDQLIEKAEEMSVEENIETSSDRAIPPFDMNAQHVEHIYRFNDIITKEELEELNVKHWIKIKPEEVEELRQQKRTPLYILDHLQQIATTPKKDRLLLKKLLYLSYLLRFRLARDSHLNDENQLGSLFGTQVPRSIIERFYDLFCEKVDDPITGVFKYTIPPKNKDLITSYILVLCLHIEDNFILEPSLIAADLKLTKTKVFEYLKGLGCVVELSSKRKKKLEQKELPEEQEIDKETAASSSAPSTPSREKTKVARLKVPLTFPKPKRGPTKR